MSKLMTDRFRKARGGHSRLLQIACTKCKHEILKYQKDGSGPLKRMYFDRIHAPAGLVRLQRKQLNTIPLLTCPTCRAMIGLPYVYQKENRKAFRVFQDAVVKKIVKT